MTGAEHYLEAERLLALGVPGGALAETFVARAQVHATLALAAAARIPATTDRDGWPEPRPAYTGGCEPL